MLLLLRSPHSQHDSVKNMVNTMIMDDDLGNYHDVPTDRIARREGLHYVNVNPTEWSLEARSCLGRKDFGGY